MQSPSEIKQEVTNSSSETCSLRLSSQQDGQREPHSRPTRTASIGHQPNEYQPSGQQSTRMDEPITDVGKQSNQASGLISECVLY